MAEIICEDCGKKMFHENEATLKIEESVHKKFCRKKPSEAYSHMHRDLDHMATFDPERKNDASGKPIIK
ncbi:hypothetical protein QVH35_07665 [Candidatus Nitrosotenuis chungbukensis]|uniref:hypothetical protein n=1 Tax=Candidatus Nitrosotenuis chungbukensis TaxID=1353246 RepID=UPI00267200E4|nr:hypothetical protein [Candidatus Nitrosotenuis chungbukensis]WKT57292.1 hypothetical protein QVH35_07665 [Candidatus Nitrosotenuis chungbukensis]